MTSPTMQDAAEGRGWQPIEAAPKDGRFIWLSDGFFMRLGYWCQERWADMAAAEARGPCDLHFKPMYWMPLPEPPK